jgi:hypothetical protein
MRVELPFSVEYGTPSAVPINEIIDSLISIQALIEESGGNLPHFVEGLSVEQVQVYVQSISQESPLKELFLVSLIVAFQDSLVTDVPEIIKELTGIDVPEKFHTLVTVMVMIVLFYGIGYVKDIVSSLHKDSSIKRQLSALITELAELTGKPEREIQKFLDDR